MLLAQLMPQFDILQLYYNLFIHDSIDNFEQFPSLGTVTNPVVFMYLLEYLHVILLDYERDCEGRKHSLGKRFPLG